MDVQMTNVINELENIGCIRKGDFTLKSGVSSKYYFDMRLIISRPEFLSRIGDMMYEKMGDFDIICAIPNGGMPLASYISTKYNKPLIYVRDKIKSYGTKKQIEGIYNKTDRCVIIDDVMTSGNSILDAYQILKDEVNVIECDIIVDRQESSYEFPIPIKALFTKTDYIRYQLSKITISKKSNFIFSADISCPLKMIEMIQKVGPYIVICKLHLDCIECSETSMTYEELKSRLIQLSVEHNFLLMEDRKFVDISSIVEKQYKSFSSWIDLVTVHGSVNIEVLKKLTGIVLVSNMSNNNWNFDDNALCYGYLETDRIIGFVTQYDIFSRMNHMEYNAPMYDLCRKGLDFDYYMEQHIHMNRKIVQMTPGISLAVKKEGDQNYKTPTMISTDYMIVGRAVYNAEDPIAEIMKFNSK